MDYCKECYEKYDYWCKPCQINYLKKNFTNWTSKNKKINEFIQKKQLEINKYNDIIFEWIPYNQFKNIKEMNKNNLATAVWKDGPLYCDVRKSDEKVVVLKYISQNNVNELLSKVYT